MSLIRSNAQVHRPPSNVAASLHEISHSDSTARCSRSYSGVKELVQVHLNTMYLISIFLALSS